MTSVQFDGSSEFVEDRWGIREPNGCEIVDPSSIDVVLVPLLCFDTSGHRVGYGKGFYDRFLMKLRPDCQKIGVTYWPPAHGPIDTHDGDRTLDLCITPDETFRFDETIQMPDQ